MNDLVATADLHDDLGETLASCDTQFQQFGGRRHFQGDIITVRAREDNSLLKELVGGPGAGKVAVVDAGGSVHCAMLGDKIADTAASNGWEGIVIFGAVRDARQLATIDIGVKALGTNPRKSLKHGAGERDVVVAFGGAVFTPGARLVSDDDGIVVFA